MRAAMVRDALLGLCVGDALGVPVEFESRRVLESEPVLTMRGYGTHHQPKGTWSDDSSLALCLADQLGKGYSLYEIGDSFQRWLQHGEWTPHGSVFDYGHTTYEAIRNLQQGVSPVWAGGRSENSNGNGSLMRILPLVFCFPEKRVRIKATEDVSCITHAHPRSQLACVIYIEMARALCFGASLRDAYQSALRVVGGHYTDTEYTTEYRHLERVLTGNIDSLPKAEIESSGYVVHTLEAALWCLLRHDNYADTVLAAVNLGEDTDTTAAVAGGLAGMYYGTKGIPEDWLEVLARREEIIEVADRLAARWIR